MTLDTSSAPTHAERDQIADGLAMAQVAVPNSSIQAQTLDSSEKVEDVLRVPDVSSEQADYFFREPASDPNHLGPPHHGVSGHIGQSASESTVVTERTGIESPSRYVRTLPAWIQSVDYPEDESEADPTARLLPSQPDGALVAQHNHAPYDRSRIINSSELDDTPAAPGGRPRESRWKTFSKVIAYPREPGLEEKLVTPDWLDEHCCRYSEPWRGRMLEGDDIEDPMKIVRQQRVWYTRIQRSLLRSPGVPLILRLTVWVFSLAALALGASIKHLSSTFGSSQDSSSLMAIIVDAVALVYLVYITYDEYMSKPLGLRSPRAKARLILLDLFFIVFDSANLALAMQSLSAVQGSCTTATINQVASVRHGAVCDRQKTLASVLLIALLAWLMTFVISVLRLVERVSQ